MEALPTAELDEQPNEPSRKRRWVTGMVALAVLGLIACFWNYLALLVTLHDLSTQSTQQGVPGALLRADDLRRLGSYPPRLLVRYLGLNRNWFVLICRALASDEIRQHDQDWRGVAPSLARRVLEEQEELYRGEAFAALERVPQWPEAEALAILGQVTASAPGLNRRRVMAALLRQCPALHDTLTATLQQWADSPSLPDAYDALALLAEFFPTRPAPAALFQRLCNDPQAAGWEVYQAALLQRTQPAWRAAALERATAALVGSDEAQFLQALQYVWFQPDQFNLLVRAALRQPDAALRLQLVLGLGQGDPRQKVPRLRRVQRADGRWTDQFMFIVSGKPLTADNERNLVKLLLDPNPDVRGAAARQLYFHLPDHESDGNVHLYKPVGACDPANRPIFLQLLRDPKGQLDWVALMYFAGTNTMQADDIPLLAAGIERMSLAPRTAYTRYSIKVLQALLQRFPADPQVLAFLDRLFQPQTDLWYAHPAADFLAAQGIDPLTRYQQLEKRYLRLRYPARLALGPIVARTATLAGGFGDPKVAAEVWEYFLWQVGANDMTADDLQQVQPLLKPEALAAGLTQYFARLFVCADPPTVQGFTGLAHRMGAVPGFRAAAENQAQQSLKSSSAAERCAALEVCCALKVTTPALLKLAIAALDDPAAQVRRIAARTVAALRIQYPAVLDRLQQLAGPAGEEMERVAAIESLGQLAPNDPAVLSLLRQLQTDPTPAIRAAARDGLRATSP